MQIQQLLIPERTHIVSGDFNKKRVLDLISQLVTIKHPDLDRNGLLQQLIARERLGSTAIGEGVALPHIRLNNLERPVGALVRLNQGIDFDSPDDETVDIFFGLLVPEAASEMHLQILANLAERFSQTDFREKLRHAKDDLALYHAACEYE